jgi:hypothetical protein
MRKAPIKLAITLLPCMLSFALSSCAAADPNLALINEGNSLFDEGEYELALEKYLEVDQEAQCIEELDKTLTKKMGELLRSKDYDSLSMYLLRAPAFDFTDSDTRLAYRYLEMGARGSDEQNGYLNWLYLVGELDKLSKSGCKVASDALKGKPYRDYVQLLGAQGLYRSDEAFEHYQTADGYKLSSDEVNAYINIGEKLSITNLVTQGALISMTSEKAVDRADSDHLKVMLASVGEGKYHCKASYIDPISRGKFEYSFDLSVGDSTVSVSSYITTEEAGNESLIEGTYTKIE